MKVQINYKVVNPDFNQAYADEYKEGEESDNNWKYFNCYMCEVENVTSVELIDNGTYDLSGSINGAQFNIPVPNVTLFRFHKEDGTKTEFAASKSIIKSTHQTKSKKYDVMRCYFYINPEPSSIEICSNLMISESEMPEELKLNNIGL